MATSDILNALSSSGLGTGQGIDVTATVNQLIANLRGPEQVWQTQQQILQGQSFRAHAAEHRSDSPLQRSRYSERSRGRFERARGQLVAAGDRNRHAPRTPRR